MGVASLIDCLFIYFYYACLWRVLEDLNWIEYQESGKISAVKESVAGNGTKCTVNKESRVFNETNHFE